MTGNEPNDETPKEVRIKAKSVGLSSAVGNLTVWRSYTFAPDWYRDCLREVREGRDHHSRRREIVFAVCVAESYLMEWVRDIVLTRDFQSLDTYFPPGQTRSITDKWKEIPRRLVADSLIPASPELGTQVWADFRTLILYRNGLVHARSSRPETDGLDDERLPVPSKSVLDAMNPGWATRVIHRLIIQLNEAAGTAMPDWLEDP